MHYSKKVVKIVVIALMSLIYMSSVQAQDANDLFKDWQGEYLSRTLFNAQPEMGAMYEKVAIEAGKDGKNYTAPQVKDYFQKLMHTTFRSISLAGDTITYSDKDGKTTRLQYKKAGIIPDSYAGEKFEWYGFQALGKDAESSPYRYLLLLKPHKHNKGQPHIHLRYGNKGFKELTEPQDMKNWWPTLVKPDFDVATCIKNLDAKIMAKVLP